MENPKHSTKKLLELINQFNKVVGYKINIQTTVAFLYTDNDLTERNQKRNTAHNSYKNQEFRNKFNQRSERFPQ